MTDTTDTQAAAKRLLDFYVDGVALIAGGIVRDTGCSVERAVDDAERQLSERIAALRPDVLATVASAFGLLRAAGCLSTPEPATPTSDGSCACGQYGSGLIKD